MGELRSLFAICLDRYKQIEAGQSTLSYVRSDKGRTRSAFSMLVEIAICLLIVYRMATILTN